MTAPQADGADRNSGFAKNSLGAGTAATGIAILLLVGLLLRLVLAYVLLPGSGFESDIGTFTAWANDLAQSGPGTFYGSAGFADYPPAYLYVLWLIGGLGKILAPLAHGDASTAVAALIKIPPIFADLAVGYVLYRMVLSWRRGRADAPRLALLAAGIYVFNPVTWYDSAIWGQTDSVGALVMLLTVWALIRGNSEGATALAVLAALIKPQFGVVALPVVGAVLIRRHLVPLVIAFFTRQRADWSGQPQNPILVPARLRGWFEYERGAWRIVSSAVVAMLVLLVLLYPFFPQLDLVGFARKMAETAGGYPWLSVNAYNPWALVGSAGSRPLAFGGGWSSDEVGLIGSVSGVVVGGLLLAFGYFLGWIRALWQPDRRSIIVVTIFLALAFFILPTRVHERYMFPIFALLPLLAVVDRRWLVATIVLSIGAFINFHGILTTELYATPNLEHLPLGAFFREPLAIIGSVVLQVAGFGFVAWMLRPGAAAEPDPYAEVEYDEEDELDYAEPTGYAPEPWYAGLSAMVPRISMRRDRSALLLGEPTGRLGRKDLALLLLVFVAALFLRTYRLEVPYGMHFDEVYHARTAMEFLQDWRYDMPHSIYEYTHPHLAKYGMALGIEALGNNRVTSTADLGVPVASVVIEPRWSPTNAPDARMGDRIYVATGTGVNVYDPALPGPALVATIVGQYTSVALDANGHTLFMGASDGTLAQLPTSGFDEMRTSPQAGGLAAEAQQPAPFGSMPGLNGNLVSLMTTAGRLVGLSSGGTLVSIDINSGSETGRIELSGAADLAGVTAKSEVIVDPAQVTDRTALASQLASLLADDGNRIAAVIEAAGGPVPVAGYIGDRKDDIQSQIDDGNLDGVSITEGSGIAVAMPTGLTFVDASTLTQLTTVDSSVPVTGLALAERGPDQPTVYAAAGNKLLRVRITSDDSRLTQAEAVAMPNVVQKVFWDAATTNVHALGTTQDGSSPTVYVIEPRGNSVYADAPLSFAPQAVVMDVQRERPAEDRNDLLAFSSSGEVATVDVGNNQFAYRFPGVLLGALTAALIFLLARFLFNRRSVALIVALVVLADGMFFANARIAMNDTYVTFFMVAALTLFVPLWLGRWRNRGAIAAGLIGVGVLLGLALASKWVGAYAIGGVGLLILLRSALGRWVALAAMIGLTGLLGYIAITPNPTVVNPQVNYTFLIIMVVLTVLLAVGMALRPMRWTRDEFRFAVVLPLLAGAASLAYGALRLVNGPPAAPDALLPPSRLVAIGVAGIVVGALVAAVGWYLRRRGRGPLATAATVDPDAEPAASPPERGWLRPGSGWLGAPWLLALLLVIALPLAVYIASYIPWINLGNHWGLPFLPGGTQGQGFIDLQKSMYEYHTFQVREAHPAASPWWAWPLDLKPVWFEQNDYAGGTTAVIYDSGNIVLFWLAIPAVAWVCWQAWKRRSLALTFIAVMLFSMWLPWARVDRATFQYHFFTTLPFSFLALAYFLAELWHGPSERTWALARIAGALAIIGAPLLWLLRLPLCGLANTQSVNANTEVCANLSRDFALTDFQLVGIGIALAGLVGAGLLVYNSVRGSGDWLGGARRPLLLPAAFSVALFGAVITIVGAGLQTGTLNAPFKAHVSAELPAFVALALLCVPAYFVLQARDPKRFVIGVLTAAVVWFVAFYPNIASLPVPTPLSQIHLGLLPTWNWGFQFGLNLDPGNRDPINWLSVLLLSVAAAGLCGAAVYAIRSWRSVKTAPEEVSPLPETS